MPSKKDRPENNEKIIDVPKKEAAPVDDEKILDLARKLRAKHNIPLVDAMLQAEEQLMPKAELPEHFDIRLKVKPRVASWIIAEFGGHPKFSIEERLSAFLTKVLTRERALALQYSRPVGDIGKGKAVSMRREQFAEKAPRS